MSEKFQRDCLYVTGFSREVNRQILLSEFRKFGKITNAFLHPDGHFANIKFADPQSAQLALDEFKKSVLNWQVRFSRNFHRTHNMARYNEDDYEEEFTENLEYCNIHGQPLVVLQADNGDLYVNLKDIKNTGFALFRKDLFDSFLINTRQIGKEFELHLLSEAKNYILKNRVPSIDEEQILKTIERCKNRMLGVSPNNNFNGNRSVVTSPSNNITVTSKIEDRSDIPGNSISTTPQSSGIQRPPKSLPNNFVPSPRHHNNGPKLSTFKNEDRQFQPKGKQESFNTNNTPFPTNSKIDNMDLNSSSSSDSKTSFRKPRTRFESANKTLRSQLLVKENIAKMRFENGSIYDVTVTHKEKTKDNIYWVQNKKHMSEFEEVTIQVNEMIQDLETINPTLGQLVSAEYEGAWNRAHVINLEPLVVQFVDYGNRSTVEFVKVLPDSLKNVPALAMRVIINHDHSEPLENSDINIKIKKQYDDGTYLAYLVDEYGQNLTKGNTSKPVKHSSTTSEDSLIDDSEKSTSKPQPPKTPKPKSYFTIPKPMAELHDGDKIMLIDAVDNKFFVRTKECAVKSKEITEYIKNLDKTALQLSEVKIGQLVLSSMDGYSTLFRAIVCSKLEPDSVVTVKYIDFPGEATLSIKSLRNVDDHLANEYSTVLVTPEYARLGDMSEEVAEYVAKICQNKEKFKVILTENNFDLQSDDGSLLSETIDKLKSPKPVTETAIKRKSVESEPVKKAKEIPVVKKNKTFYDDMDWIKIEPGLQKMVCYSVQDVDDITFLPITDEVIGHLEMITVVNPTEEEPYEPEVSEMCLVSYKEPDNDGETWYRAVVLSADTAGYMVNFVDFGNTELVQSKDIRTFPNDLKDIPILGIGCECIGIPKKPEIVEYLKKLMSDGEQVEVQVKNLNGLKYEVELPEFYKKLKAEKLF